MLVSESVNPFLDGPFLYEGVNFSKIKSIAKKSAILASLFLSQYSTKLQDVPSNRFIEKNPIIVSLSNKEDLSKTDIVKGFERLGDYYEKRPSINYHILKDPMEFRTSKEGISFIKNEEKLKLKAYNIGDGKISIGYGHAEDEDETYLRVGDSITVEQAESLFDRDLRIAEEGVRRIFKSFEKKGKSVYISQYMWDSMVSMAYNMGVGALWNSEIISSLEDENYIEAADSIITTRSDSYPGLKPRREREKDLFLKGLV